MAAGMWAGIAAGYADIQDRKRYEQERQDKLDLLNRERQDKLFGLALSLGPKYAAEGVLTPSGGGGGTQGPSSSFYEKQLLSLGFEEQQVLDLQEKGPSAMAAAIEIFKDHYDPTADTPKSLYSGIAESIFVETSSPTANLSVDELVEKVGLDLSVYTDQEANLLKATLANAIKPPKPTVHTASTFTNTQAPKPEDAKQLTESLRLSLLGAVQQNAAAAGETDVRRAAEWQKAETAFSAGNPTLAIGMLREEGLLEGIVKPLFETWPQYQRIPLGVFESVRTPTQTSTTGVPPQAAIEALRANSSDPSIIRAFEEKYGVSAGDYL